MLINNLIFLSFLLHMYVSYVPRLFPFITYVCTYDVLSLQVAV